MKRRALIKICGMTDPDNVAQIVELKPDLLGFIFVPESPRFIGGQSRALQVVRGVPRAITTVGVFKDASHLEVVRVVQELDLGVVQLHGAENESYVAALQSELPSSVTVWKATLVTGDLKRAILNVPQSADRILLDGPKPGSGERFNWASLAEGMPFEKPFMIAGGIGPENISEARRLFETQPLCSGIDINSQVESAPGIKDIERVRRCIEGMRV